MIIRSEENFAEKKTISFTLAKVVLIIFGVFLLLLGVSFYLATSVLGQWFDPRQAELEANRQVIQLSQSVDSLMIEVAIKDQFIQNFKRVLSGNDSTMQVEDGIADREVNASGITPSQTVNPIDEEFRKEFEQEGVELLTVRSDYSGELQDFYFFQPIDNGIVSDGFNAQIGHYGLDLVAKKDEPIKSVADGTVIFASWTQDSGYVIAVQHRSNLISVYKHNSDLLKNVGSFVNAGDIIAIIGNTGELTSGPHLHFEIWYNGNPLNPAEFISF
ncbi:MAG: peptidoglycan DD-metalloendopeptidase family protein [Bacteroidota bacterium]